MTNYKVTYRYKDQRMEHSIVILANSDRDAKDKIEKRENYDITVIDVREDLLSWGDSLIGKLIKRIFKK